MAGTMLFLALSLVLQLTDASAGKPTAKGCQAWLAGTVARIEKLPEQKWRDAIIAALADSCDEVPSALKKAARDVRTIKDAASRDRLLGAAASSVLDPSCAVSDPASDALAIAAACPMPARPELQLPRALLGDIRAVDYLILDALATKLLAAKKYDASAERLMMDFSLSAGLRGERAKEAKRGATVRRR
jgi:hypothetical protein